MRIGQYISIIIFLLAVLGSTFNKAIVLLDYRVNQNFIASTLCENRNKPQCCCHGKCFLKKQLQKDEDGSKNNSSVSKDKSDVQLFCEENENPAFALLRKTQYSFAYIEKKYTNFPSSIFHPPGKA
ncbi:MAG: hypothetical protein JST87_19690 [Bacteroidetes bacterium]|nr:hypothetical protein [Bacteroidota bacterium]